MGAVAYSLTYAAAGLFMVRFLLPRHSPMSRIWLGLSLGLVLEMCLPALIAFPFGFTLKAHFFALIPLACLTLLCALLRDRSRLRPWDAAEKRLLFQTLLVMVPLTVLGGYLQYTHTCRVAEDGSWHVGQSTYGDLSMHMAFITGMKDAPFPPEYSLFPGTRLSYPFLTDSLSTTMMLMGFRLQEAITVPGTWMMALLYAGVVILGRDLTRGRKTVVLAAFLFFLNGGLGFLYDLDQAAGYNGEGSLKILDRLRFIMEGYYKTPTNQPDPNNLRWSNLIADLLIPQRTLLGGYCVFVPCLYLLFHATGRAWRRETGGVRALVLLGVMGGVLPLIHTHSFLALALCSFGLMVFDLIHEKEKRAVLLRYALYALIVVVLSLPQLFSFTFRQVFSAREARSSSFLVFQFNWVNNPGGQGMRDFYLWFYVKNIGLPALLILFACFERDRHMRRLLAGMLPMILVMELVRFQPNEYDNNKVLYLAYLLGCYVTSDYLRLLWHHLKGVRARPVMAAMGLVILFLSAVLTLCREVVSDYEAYSPNAVAAAEYAREETDRDSIFLTGRQHLNPVASIAGRRIVCGADLYLYWHGLDTTERALDIADFYEDPEGCRDVLDKYSVDYVMVSGHERSQYAVNENGIRALCREVYRNPEYVIYQVVEEDGAVFPLQSGASAEHPDDVDGG